MSGVAAHRLRAEPQHLQSAGRRAREAFHANGTTTCRFESDGETRWIVDFGDDYRCNLLLEDIYPFDGRRYPTFATGTTLENGLFLP